MRHARPLIALLAVLALTACTPAGEPAREVAATPKAQAQPKPPPAQTGMASYYGREFAGKETASGEPHRPQALTAASRTLPLGTVAKVTNLESGRSVAVEVNDRGPYAKGRLDVSRRAAEALDMKQDGVAPVAVQPLAAPDGERGAGRPPAP